MEIQITSLKKTYGNKTALNGVSLTIGNGMFGLIGRNGAGKTTLMQILATLSRPSGGQVTFDGIPLKDTKKIRSFIGYLPQEFSLYPDMSVLDVMRYLAALSDIPGEVWRERIPRLLKQVNLWDDRTKKAGKLSGGMKQRLGIAQALLNDPQVLIVDEPTAGLDPEERFRFYALLDDFSSSRTVIVSSHIMSDIESVCENVAVLDAGRLLFTGTVRDLAKKAEVCSVSCVPTALDGYMELLRQLDKGVEK
ncbi:MAG: ABC transporter ATP-binding protein [Lachnospiraceae bacterium]|nr:ABC transporter ATP-binding protein [Lachnospiraceae bacterium]